MSFWKNRKPSDPKPDTSRHITNKDEGRLLRRLMSETGMAEEEIRTYKKYRKMLSKEQRSGEDRNSSEVVRKRIEVMRYVCKQHGINQYHQDFKKLYSEEWQKRREEHASWGRFDYYNTYRKSCYPIPTKEGKNI